MAIPQHHLGRGSASIITPHDFPEIKRDQCEGTSAHYFHGHCQYKTERRGFGKKASVKTMGRHFTPLRLTTALPTAQRQTSLSYSGKSLALGNVPNHLVSSSTRLAGTRGYYDTIFSLWPASTTTTCLEILRRVSRTVVFIRPAQSPPSR